VSFKSLLLLQLGFWFSSVGSLLCHASPPRASPHSAPRQISLLALLQWDASSPLWRQKWALGISGARSPKVHANGAATLWLLICVHRYRPWPRCCAFGRWLSLDSIGIRQLRCTPPSPSSSPHSVCPLRPLNLHCPGMLQASHVTYFFERLRCPGLLHVPSCAICQHLSRVIIRSVLCVQASMYGVFNAVLLRGLTATAVASFAASDMPTFPDVSP
jgi:hypothetical protein